MFGVWFISNKGMVITGHNNDLIIFKKNKKNDYDTTIGLFCPGFWQFHFMSPIAQSLNNWVALQQQSILMSMTSDQNHRHAETECKSPPRPEIINYSSSKFLRFCVNTKLVELLHYATNPNVILHLAIISRRIKNWIFIWYTNT